METTRTYKGFDAAELRRTFEAMHNPQDWQSPRTQDECRKAVAAIEFCTGQSRQS